jgi:hypothetical protein
MWPFARILLMICHIGDRGGMEIDMTRPPRKKRRRPDLGMWLVIGLAFGLALGVTMENLTTGLVIGLGIGMLFGSGLMARPDHDGDDT